MWRLDNCRLAVLSLGFTPDSNSLDGVSPARASGQAGSLIHRTTPKAKAPARKDFQALLWSGEPDRAD